MPLWLPCYLTNKASLWSSIGTFFYMLLCTEGLMWKLLYSIQNIMQDADVWDRNVLASQDVWKEIKVGICTSFGKNEPQRQQPVRLVMHLSLCFNHLFDVRHCDSAVLCGCLSLRQLTLEPSAVSLQGSICITKPIITPLSKLLIYARPDMNK